MARKQMKGTLEAVCTQMSTFFQERLFFFIFVFIQIQAPMLFVSFSLLWLLIQCCFIKGLGFSLKYLSPASIMQFLKPVVINQAGASNLASIFCLNCLLPSQQHLSLGGQICQKNYWWRHIPSLVVVLVLGTSSLSLPAQPRTLFSQLRIASSCPSQAGLTVVSALSLVTLQPFVYFPFLFPNQFAVLWRGRPCFIE